MRRRTGKIARLPRPARDRVCELLRDGATYLDVIARVTSEFSDAVAAVGGLKDDNVGEWVNGSGAPGASSGYREWLAIQERIESARDRHTIRLQTQEQLRAEGLDPNAANAARLAEIVEEVLHDFDPHSLRDLARSKPAAVLGMLSKIQGALTKGHIDFAKLQLQHEKLKRSVAEASGQLEKLRHTTTDEDRQRIIDLVNQTLGLSAGSAPASASETS